MMNYTHMQIQANTGGRDFIVGDIHGCHADFMLAMREIEFDYSKDRMFSVGDLVDRGPDSALCLSLVNEDWFYSVLGNHEDMFIGATIEGRYNYNWWVREGGGWDKNLKEQQIIELEKIVRNLPMFITLSHSSGKKIGICHAQPPTENWLDIQNGLSFQEIQRALWGRTVIHYKLEKFKVDNVDLTVHGHTPTQQPELIGNSLFIDTGSFLALEKYGSYENYGITIINLDEWIEENLND